MSLGAVAVAFRSLRFQATVVNKRDAHRQARDPIVRSLTLKNICIIFLRKLQGNIKWIIFPFWNAEIIE